MFDVLTIAAVADELADALLDGRIQRVGLLDRLTFGAEVYAAGRRRWLLASADNRDARLHLTATAPSFDPALVTPFGLLLRKYLRGGVLVGVEQPPLERQVRLSIAKRLAPHNGPRPRAADTAAAPADDDLIDVVEDDNIDDLGDDITAEVVYVHLQVELMGRHSNLILVGDDGLIMGSAKHVTPQMSRVRPVRPRLPYAPPPPVDKPDPRRLTAPIAEELLRTEPAAAPLAAVLVRRLRGLSPQMAREIAHRALGDAAAPVGEADEDGVAALARETRALLEPLLTSAWAPRVYRRDGEVIAFAPVPMAHLAAGSEEEAVATVSAAADLALAAGGAGTPSDHAQRRARLAASVRDARGKVEGRLASLEAQEAKSGEAERLREWGELIYAYLWQIRPGQAELAVDGVTVPLDPARPAKESAQDYFERYRKAQGAGARLPALHEAAERDAAYLDQLLVLVDQARGFAELDALAAEWEAHRGPAPDEKGRPRRSNAAPRRPKPLLDAHGHAVYVGRSGRENDLITFDLAGPDDTWLHARGVPGSHVVVRWRPPAAEEDPRVLEAAAALAAHYSGARAASSVEVDLTRRRHVRKIKGAGPGMVTYRQERTVSVRPRDEAGVGDVLRPG